MQTVTLPPFFVKQAGHLICFRVKQVSREKAVDKHKFNLHLATLPENVLDQVDGCCRQHAQGHPLLHAEGPPPGDPHSVGPREDRLLVEDRAVR